MWRATGGSAKTVLTESQIAVQLHPCTALRHIAVGGRAVGVGTQICTATQRRSAMRL
jgi:hypothetical protein